MKLTLEELNNYIQLYLNDVEDYGTKEEFILAESTLKIYPNLITENTSDALAFLKESLTYPGFHEDEDVVKGFIEYVETA